MTNYTEFPSWRCHTGFTIKFNDHQFSWSHDTISQRKYLATSNYITGAVSIYIGKIDKWMEVEEFKTFCIEENNKKETKEIKKDMLSIEDGICPQCGGKLQLKSGKFGPFIGCSNYPNCKFTKNMKINK